VRGVPRREVAARSQANNLPPLASVNVATTVYDFTLAGEGDGRDRTGVEVQEPAFAQLYLRVIGIAFALLAILLIWGCRTQ